MFADVIIDQDAKALDKVFEYKIPDEMSLDVGMRVYVPFGNRILQGYIVAVKDKADYEESKIKSIISRIEDFSAIKPEMLELMKFMAEKNHLKLASILRIADSMDRSHTQHIEDFNISFKADTMIIHTNNRAVSNLEKMAITEKSDLFEFVFGYTIIVS